MFDAHVMELHKEYKRCLGCINIESFYLFILVNNYNTFYFLLHKSRFSSVYILSTYRRQAHHDSIIFKDNACLDVSKPFGIYWPFASMLASQVETL